MLPVTQTTTGYNTSTLHCNSCNRCLSIWRTLWTSQFFMRMLWWGMQRIKLKITKLPGLLIQASWLRLRWQWPGAGRKTNTTRSSQLNSATWWVLSSWTSWRAQPRATPTVTSLVPASASNTVKSWVKKIKPCGPTMKSTKICWSYTMQQTATIYQDPCGNNCLCSC